MGGRGSGRPVAQEKIEVILDMIEEGISIREACRLVGVHRCTFRRHRKSLRFRRIYARCPSCRALVRVPCIACLTTGKIERIDSWLAAVRQGKCSRQEVAESVNLIEHGKKPSKRTKKKHRPK